jgi:hypothetical protein
MSVWEQHDLTTRIVEILGAAHLNTDEHHFGRPYVTSYQIAIELARRYPQTVAAIGKPIGGTGVGQHNSFAQYLGGELSGQIRREEDRHPVEGAFLSNERVSEIRYTTADGQAIVSSLTGTPFDLALFRLR